MYDHFHLRKIDKSFKYRFLFGWNCLVIAIGTMLMVAGTYGSIVDIIDAYHKNGGTTVSPPSLAACPLSYCLRLHNRSCTDLCSPSLQPFSCEDNSQ